MRVFIMCPAKLATGGTELLHQLSYVLSCSNVENYMVYPNREKTVCPTPETFLKYNVKYVSEYVDSKESILVLPETMVHNVDFCKEGKTVIWWLSVNNYISSYSKRFPGEDYDYFKLYERKNVFHFVQSYYAALFLKTLLKIETCYYLTDYINDDIVQIALEKGKNCVKEDIVLYNPRKGFANVEPIMQKCKDEIKWIPLQNMSPTEMADMMCRAKVYIDFGGHPGKDRIPREAAVCGCCIITNTLGSAAYQQDINIAPRYKFADMSNHDLVLETIYDLIENYEERIVDFELYRSGILSEKDRFYSEADTFVRIMGREIGETTNTFVKSETSESLQLLKDASGQILELTNSLLNMGANLKNAEMTEKMLTMDYIMQIMREVIYAELIYLPKEE